MESKTSSFWVQEFNGGKTFFFENCDVVNTTLDQLNEQLSDKIFIARQNIVILRKKDCDQNKKDTEITV